MADEEAKAVQEASKAVGNITEAAKQFGGFIAKYISGPLEQGIGIYEDKLKFIRYERQLRLMKRTEELSAEYGLALPSRTVPMKIAIPIFQAASMEEDDYLQDKWASLLINASNAEMKNEIKRVHISILENLSALDVLTLDKIYSDDEDRREGIYIQDLPQGIDKGIAANIMEKMQNGPSKEIVLSLANLARLGCIDPTATYGGGVNFDVVTRTELGRDFIDACRLKHQ
ncbi:Abi-alpha family protein [Brenneria uluponensis]|uniref:Abi-alpha family protein n=1 Tax=Brenneria uluponensis TaxID=3057057 RepID=UPI0028EF48D1|nr:Abi-alpha family protein [Brenneria ulupoensis]